MAATAEETGTGFDPNKATKEMDKYSRQVGAYGVAVMRFLRKLRVLIVGSKGVGIEAAKNLVLTGCRAVHLHDEGLVELADLGTNFFLRPEHVGQPRAASLVAAVQELNEDVQVEAVSGDVLALLQSGKYRAVIVTDNTVALSQLAAWDEWCRAHSVAFTVALASGVLGFLFADFGPRHVCSDANGELHKYVAIQKIERNEAGKFLLTLDDAHDLDDGDHLQVEDVKGIDNFEGQVFEIRRVYSAGGTLLANQLVLDKLVPPKDPVTGERSPPVEVDFRTWGTYEKGGFIREVKKETVFQHLPLTEALHKAPILFPEVMKSFSGGPSRGLLAQVALWSFVAAHGQLPRLHNAEDATALHTLAKEAHSSFSACGASNVADLDASELAKVALYARTEISGLCAFLGGVVAQEVVKKSSKWTPISQFLIHELYDLVNEQPPADAAPQGSRYDHQIALFGSAFQDSLLADKWFLVGCGALGCEYMKSFALMGVGCGAEGLLSATDMDTIEVSNLARQFLFRREHVGKMKSLCAAAAAKKMNPDINIRIYTDPVGPKTENIFNETFWLSLTGVVNALDNVQARLYVDSRCVLFRRPLLESGTLGTLANTEVIVPHKTASYGENHVETKQRYVPQCTFKNFPYLIEHTIGWAGKTGEFATLFVEPANDLKSAIAGLEQFWKNLARVSKESKKVERLRPVVELLPKLHHLNFETCVQLAFQRLISQYRDRILSLTHYCPRDMLKTDRDSGQTVPFWSAPKRFPTALSWDPANPDPAHVEYIYNTANLYAHMFHLDPRRDEAPGRPDFARYLVELQLTAPEWTPGDKSSLGEVEEETEAAPAAEGAAAAEGKEDEVERDRRLLAEFTEAINSFDWEPLRAQQAALRAVDAKDSLIRPAEFEKDDDTNFHIDFVTSASNLRARNYDIPAADRHKTKMTAGNIIPAIATTTAMITGLNSIEFLKLKLGLTIDKMRNSNVNLGVSDFQLFEPGPPKQAQADYDPIEMEVIDPLPPAFTVWDTIHINRGDITLERLLADFPSIHLGAVPTNIVRQEIHSDKKEDKKEEEKEDTPTKLIYSDSPLFTSRIAGYMPRLITDIWQQEYGPLPDSSFLPLTVSAQLNGRPVKIPPVLYQYK